MEAVKNKGRNSVVEIERLLASLWVLFFHRFEDILHGYLAVEFFFAISGLFFIATFRKENDKGFFKGLLSYNYKRIKPILITLILCFPFTLYRIVNVGDLGYLWFIPYLLAVLSFFFVLRRLIKDEKLFLTVTIALTAICLGLLVSGVTYVHTVRAIGMVGLGICLSYIPKLPKKNLFQYLSLAITGLAIAGIAMLEILCKDTLVFHDVYFLAIIPPMIYFSNQIKFSNNIINEICCINFGIYAFQEIVRFLSLGVYLNPFVYCAIVVCIAALAEMVTRFVKSEVKKHKEKKRFIRRIV